MDEHRPDESSTVRAIAICPVGCAKLGLSFNELMVKIFGYGKRLIEVIVSNCSNGSIAAARREE